MSIPSTESCLFMRCLKRTAVLMTLALLAGGVNAQDGQAQPISAVDLPPELDRVLRDYESAWSAGDAGALAALFTEDGFVRRGGRWIQGRDSIRVAYENSSGPLQLRALSYAAEDSVGYIVGEYGYGQPPDVNYGGKFILAIRRSGDGPWLIAADLDG